MSATIAAHRAGGIRMKRERYPVRDIKRDANHLFAKGTRNPGRPKGSHNKTTKILREATLRAAEEIGEDGYGRDGLTGYLKRIAVTHPKSFVMLLSRILPLQLHGLQHELQDPATYASVSEVIEKMRERNIPIPSYLLESSVVDLKPRISLVRNATGDLHDDLPPDDAA